MLLTQWIRAFRRTGAGVVTDLSLDLQDETASVTLDLQTDEYLYVAQQMPFNNLYFDLVTPNATGSNVTVEERSWVGTGFYSGPLTETRAGNQSQTLEKKSLRSCCRTTWSSTISTGCASR